MAVRHAPSYSTFEHAARNHARTAACLRRGQMVVRARAHVEVAHSCALAVLCAMLDLGGKHARPGKIIWYAVRSRARMMRWKM